MKILLLGDASNYHNCLASALRQRGHDVTVASNGSGWMSTSRDINIARRPGKLGGLMLWARTLTSLAPRLRGYDVVQLVSTNFMELRTERLAKIFDTLRRHNGAVYLTYLCNDPQYVATCVAPDSPLRYSEWHIQDRPSPHRLMVADTFDNWLSPEMKRYSSKIWSSVDGVATALYEYHLSALRNIDPRKLVYAGIPVDTESIRYSEPDLSQGRIFIMQPCHAGREVEKGADVMRSVLERVAADYPERVRYEFVQNVPYDSFVKKLHEAHIVVDQLYSYTPATTALLAMAMGKTVVSGAEEEYYRFIGEEELRPIINADPLDPDRLYRDIVGIIDNPGELLRRGREGRLLVERHNDYRLVAQRFEQLWSRK